MPPRQINPAITQSTEDAIMRALQFNAAERFQTALEMRLALFDSLRPLPAAAPAPESTSLPVEPSAEPDLPADPPANPPPAGSPTQPTIDLRRLFKDGVPQRLKDGTTIVPVAQEQEIRIEVSSSQQPGLRRATVKLAAGVGLLLQPWRPKPMVILAPDAGQLPHGWPAVGDTPIVVTPAPGGDRLVAQVTDWPGKYHTWEFALLDLGREYPLYNDRSLCLYLDQDQVAAAWRISHQAEGLSPETFYLLLGKKK